MTYNGTRSRAMTAAALLASILALAVAVMPATAFSASAPESIGTTQDDERGQPSRTVRERTTTIHERTIIEREERVEETPSVRRAAIFVRNRAPGLDDKVGSLQDMVIARVSEDARFSIISRENVVNAVAAFAEEGPNRGFELRPEEDLDRILSNRSSALRLAQLLQADNVFIVSIVGYNAETRRVRHERLNIDERVREERLRLQYEILDINIGGTLASDMVRADKTTRLAGFEGEPDYLLDLLDEGSEKLAKAFIRRVIPPSEAVAGRVEVTIYCSIEDLEIPDIVRNEHGEWVVDKRRFPVELLDVSVELNGVVEGSAPGTLFLPPGLNRIRLSRAGFRDWERHINITEGMTPLRVAMQMTDENRLRMREDMALFERLRIDQKLSDGHLEVLQGYAQMLRQSGYRVDIRHDIKVDTEEAPPVHLHRRSYWMY